MQANKEIGKIQKGTPQLVGWALEGFLEELTQKAAELCKQNGDTKIMPCHIKEVILREHQAFGFLKSHLSSVPDFEVNPKLPAKLQAEIVKGCKRKQKEAEKSGKTK